MYEVERTVEDCIDEIFADYSIHPTGVIIARKNGHTVQITPKREAGVLTGWAYSFTDTRGNVVVRAAHRDYAKTMIHHILTYAWEAR